MTIGVDARPKAKIELSLPIVAAPMDTVCEKEMALALWQSGALGIIHRYKEQSEVLRQGYWLRSKNCELFGLSVSTNQCFDPSYINEIVKTGARVICVDTANGHSDMTINAVRALRAQVPEKTHIMTGNISTVQALIDLVDAGADSVRVGIGGGAACTTRIVSGHGAPTLWSVVDCSSGPRGAIIADGGIRNTGDMVKSFAAGASAVMVGRMLAGHDESPKVTNERGERVYRGMASSSAQLDWRGSFASEEGVEGAISDRGPVSETLKEVRYGLGSGCSYTGVDKLSLLEEKAKFIFVTTLTAKESRPRV